MQPVQHIKGWKVVGSDCEGYPVTTRNVYIARTKPNCYRSGGVEESEYLHSDGIVRGSTLNEEREYTGWFRTVADAKAAIELHSNDGLPQITEQEFIKKWKGEISGFWAESADTLFWARSYKMPRKRLVDMCRDYMRVSLENRAYCCVDVVKNTLG